MLANIKLNIDKVDQLMIKVRFINYIGTQCWFLIERF